jgi:SNF2 family DNA or RNA helicase
VKLILIGIKLAVGLTLTAASDTATIEFGWTPAVHDQAEDRVHRIGQKNAVVAYYLVASKTIEEKIGKLIEEKRRVVNAVADGDPLKGAEQGSVLGDLLAELTGRMSLSGR